MSDELTTSVAAGSAAEPVGVPAPVDVPVATSDLSEADRGTRSRVLTSILSQGPSTAADLGVRLQLTPAAIRRHITALTEAGLVTSREQRIYGHRGRGRPARVFLLTDAGRASFPQAYDELALQAIEQLIEAAGPDALTRLAEQRVRPVAEANERLRHENPDADPLCVLTGALNEGGYVASIEPVASGRQLVQHHCPVAQVAARHPELCQVETQLISRLLDSHVQRLATIAHGETVCTTHVPTMPIPRRTDTDPDSTPQGVSKPDNQEGLS